jgi:hypothetical protein
MRSQKFKLTAVGFLSSLTLLATLLVPQSNAEAKGTRRMCNNTGCNPGWDIICYYSPGCKCVMDRSLCDHEEDC